MSIENQVPTDRRIIGIPVDSNPTTQNITIAFDYDNNKFRFIPPTTGARSVLRAPGANINKTINSGARYIVGYNALTSNYIPASTTITRAGTIRRLHIDVLNNDRTDATTMTVHKDGVATDLFITIPAGETGNYENDEDSFTVDDGDRIAFAFSSAGSNNTAVLITSIPIVEFEYS